MKTTTPKHPAREQATARRLLRDLAKAFHVITLGDGSEHFTASQEAKAKRHYNATHNGCVICCYVKGPMTLDQYDRKKEMLRYAFRHGDKLARRRHIRATEDDPMEILKEGRR
jgi:hypothetical protein